MGDQRIVCASFTNRSIRRISRAVSGLTATIRDVRWYRHAPAGAATASIPAPV
jgi:hypothetical protein